MMLTLFKGGNQGVYSKTGRMMDIQKKIGTLFELKQQALRLSPSKALEFITSSPDGPAIVHSMAEQDFHCLVNEIGPQDCLELLSLATDSQWEYILDVESWQKDRVAVSSVLRWFDLMMQADAARFVEWISSGKKDFLELFLFYQVEAGLREENQDPSDFGDDYFTFDDLFYVRFVRKGQWAALPETNTEDDKNDEEDDIEAGYRDQVLYDFLRRVSAEDHQLFQELLFYSAAVIPAEAEEELYRLRNLRLAEKGLLPFDEAIGVYQPLSGSRRLAEKGETASTADVTVPVPLIPATAMDRTMLFSQALALIDTPETLRGLQAELAALCNRIAVADQIVIKERTAMKTVVRKACGYIGLGLDKLTGREDDERPDPARTVAAMTTHFLADIFRIGYGRALTVKHRAEKWYRQSWFRQYGLPVSFWGDEQQAILAGLLVKRPLYYDVNLGGGRYREFETAVDIRTASAALERIMVFDGLLAQADVDPSPVSFDILTYKNLLLTLWARDCLGLPPVVDFIPLADFRSFYDDLSAASPVSGSDPAEYKRTVTDQRKQLFLDWLAMITGISAYTISRDAGTALETLFDEIDETFGHISPAGLDPRFVDMFLIC